ncbi:hypothetical protein [Streptomyces sp. IBSBF 2435]|uniref:hypothetical protein n=1 Tax=Streptomyces sp. IBSBF 2435 TaxID=2903531 RepID=UPI002FDBB7E9
MPRTGALFVAGGLAPAGLPPFGTALGKAPAEDAAGHAYPWLPAVYAATSAPTGGAVLRAALRIFWARTVRTCLNGLRRLHSGHLGDYLAWLASGVAVLCAVLAGQG